MKQQFQSAKMGAPPNPPILTKTVGDTVYRVFSWPDRSFRITADTAVKREGDSTTWKHQERNGTDLRSIALAVTRGDTTITDELLKEISTNEQ